MTPKRLPDDDVRRLREEYAVGATQRDLAEKYGISQNTVSSLVLGKARVQAGGPIREGAVAKLTEQDVAQIRTEAARGASNRDLAKRFGVSAATIGNVVTGKSFGQLPGPIAAPPKRPAALTEEQAADILARSNAGESRAEIAAAHGVTVWAVDAVRRRAKRSGGSAPKNTGLAPEAARAIRERYTGGETQTALAAEFGISQQMVSAIVRGELYREPGGLSTGSGA